GVFATADVGEKQQVRIACPQATQRLLDDAVTGEVFRADLVLRRRESEQDHARNPQRLEPIHLAIERPVDRVVEHPWHRSDFPLALAAVDHEQWLDEVAGTQLMLAHQLRHGLTATAAPGTEDVGGGHGGKTRERKASPQPRERSALPLL